MRNTYRIFYEKKSWVVSSKVVSKVEAAGTYSELNPVAACFIWGRYGQKY
jgi:ABC-type xylose transport system permease subunit